MAEQKVRISEHEIMEKDVKSMSYEELMTAVRFLDHERCVLASSVQDNEKRKQSKFDQQEKVSKAA
jgi:hypothetical protein